MWYIVIINLQIDKAAVDRDEVDQSEDDNLVQVFAPSCTILLQWTGKPGSEVTPLKAYRVMISGTTKPSTSFIIFHNPWLDEAGQKNAVSKRTVPTAAAGVSGSLSRTLSELQ